MKEESNVSAPQGETKAARIEWGLAKKRSPYFGKSLVRVKVTGSGRFEDGQFCTLDCYARFHYTADVPGAATRLS